MKTLIVALIISIALNVVGGVILFKPRPTPQPVKLVITNQNYLPEYVYIPENTPDYFLELNAYRTRPFVISNETGFARVALVDRFCIIPFPKEPERRFNNMLSVGYAYPNTILLDYKRYLFSVSTVLLYGGLTAGYTIEKTAFLGVSAGVLW